MTTTVHRAYDYKGYAWHQESPEGKVVAVDVEFAGYSPAFDLDDMLLLIYSAPRTMKAVKLSYWDQALTPEAAMLRGTGPTLRPPGHGTKP